MEIKTYNGTKANFYIQSKGLHSGRPLKNPIPNCFAVNTDIENAFEIVYSLWIGKKFQNNIIGSVIPFIRITETKQIVFKALKVAKNYHKGKLKTLELMDKNIENLKRQIKLIKELQYSTAKSLN